jgi:hypothetical protein
VNDDVNSLENEMDISFPMITISVSYDDLNEPIHVDLGSVPPFIAVSVMEKVLEMLKPIVIGPKITFQGVTLAEPIFSSEIGFQQFLNQFDIDEDEEGNQ